MSITFSHINYLEDATPITASSEQTSFPASNVIHPFRSKSWRTQTGQISNQYIIFDCGYQLAPTGFVMINEQRGIQLSPNAEIRIKSSNDGNFGTPLVNILVPWDAEYISYYSNTALGSARMWKIEINDPDNVDNYLEVGNMFLGESLSFSSTDLNMNWQDTKIDDSQKVVSDGGEPWYDVLTQRDRFSFELMYMSKAEHDTMTEFIRLVGQHKPFYISLDPELKITSTQSELSRYVRFTNEPTFANVFYKLYNISLTVEEAI